MAETLRPDPLTPEEVHAAHHAFGVAHDCTTLDPVCGWDTRRGDGPIGGPCRLPPFHDGPHDPMTEDYAREYAALTPDETA
jgi:hypothetical protein